MGVLTSETCWTVNNKIINKWHQVSLSLFSYKDDARSNKRKIISDIYIQYKQFILEFK